MIMYLRAFLISLLSLSYLSATADAAGIAKVAGEYGSPTANGRSLNVGDDVQEHDKIIVNTGNVQLIFTDGTKLVVGEHSTLVVEKYLMKGGNQVSNFSVDALRGTFRFITGGSAKAAYNINTANATIGIRGTGFDFYVGSNTGVVVLEGKVKLCAKAGGCVNLNPKCDAGLTAGNGAGRMDSRQFANAVAHLPYLQSQAFLKQPFKLPVSSCSAKFSDINNGPGNKSFNAPPPPPPPPPGRSPGCGNDC